MASRYGHTCDNAGDASPGDRQRAFQAGKNPSRTSITVVMDDNYPPYAFRDADHMLIGYLGDSWALWEKKTGVHVDLLATDWKTAQQRMTTHHADVIDTIFRTPEREHHLDFTAPYEQIPVSIYAYSHISGITDLNTLRGFMVGVKAGDACVDKLEAAGIRDLQPYASYTALVNAAVAKKVRVFCIEQHKLTVTPSIGVALYPGDGEDIEILCRRDVRILPFIAPSDRRYGHG